jgi:hypothetical protein
MMIEKDYNIERGDLIIKEYGRNVQKMVEYAVSIEDRNKRTRLAYSIVSVMQQVSPIANPNEDYYQKIWNHINIISNYKLDIDFPIPVEPKEIHDKKPERIPYKNNSMRYKFYGENIDTIIKDVAEMEDGERKTSLAIAIANQMKTMYIGWNREIVGDEVIKDHIREISKGKINFVDGTNLVSAGEIMRGIKIAEDLQKQQNFKNGKKGFQKKKPTQNQNFQYKSKRK